MRNFRELEIWNEAIKFCEVVYSMSNNFPKDERFGLTSQMRRAAVSIPSNIAEGCRGSNKELKHYLNIALGSSFELETQIILCNKLGFIDKENLAGTIESINLLQRRINAFRNCL